METSNSTEELDMFTRSLIGMVVVSAFSLPALSEPEVGIWNQSKWDKCLWGADQPAEKKPIANKRCMNSAHYTPEGKHVFVLGESQLGSGDVLAPEGFK